MRGTIVKFRNLQRKVNYRRIAKCWPIGAGALVLWGALLATPAGSPHRPGTRGGVEAGGGVVTDIAGNQYRTVLIGRQEWMAENLRTTRLNDGTPVPQVKDGLRWTSLRTPAYTWYANNEANHKVAYGALYNWYAVGTGKLCPQGWRVPTDADWQVLVDALGGKAVAGGKLKSAMVAAGGELDISEGELEVEQPTYVPDGIGQRAAPDSVESRVAAAWNRPNTGATNETGFSAIPGGRRTFGQGSASEFENKGTYGHWWSSTEAFEFVAWSRLMTYDNSHVSRMDDSKSEGLSVCCVRE